MTGAHAMTRAVIAMALVMACSRPPTPAPQPGPAPSTSGGEMWGKDFFPNVALTTQRGEHVRFFDDLIKDKVVAINFIYTRCTDSCPMETARMAEVQKLLGDRLGKDIFFYSISIDPANDTPAVLAAYAQSWHAGPGWTFLTGSDADVTLLRKKLGVFQADLKKKDHNVNLIIGNQRTGRWMKRSPFENPYVLADQLGSWLHNWKLPRPTDRDYASAPEVRNISTGEELFRTRCAACHTVGGGARTDVAERRAGPDLLNISQHRDRAWLEHWILQPDQMIASKDPLALALLAQNQNLVMPNLRISREEVGQLLGYLDAESLAAEQRRVGAASEPARRTLPPLSEASTAQLRRELALYDTMRRALAADDLETARTQARMLEPSFAVVAGYADAARQIVAAADLDAARAGFGALSHGLIGVLADHPALQRGFWLFECPMAPGYRKWLQADGALTNPYLGTRMPKCGTQATRWAT